MQVRYHIFIAILDPEPYNLFSQILARSQQETGQLGRVAEPNLPKSLVCSYQHPNHWLWASAKRYA